MAAIEAVMLVTELMARFVVAVGDAVEEEKGEEGEGERKNGDT